MPLPGLLVARNVSVFPPVADALDKEAAAGFLTFRVPPNFF